MSPHKRFTVKRRDGVIALGPKALIMGILNVTPDSFSDGGTHTTLADTVAHARQMVTQGADIIDVGGESTRPGADAVAVQAELDRVVPALEALAHAELDALVSIDTYKALVADQALQSGAQIVNDVHGLQRDPEIADVAVLQGAPVIIMHWDAKRDTGKDLIAEMRRYFEVSLEIAAKAGIEDERIMLDPGFGFGKSFAENYALLRRLSELNTMGYPLLAGTSRKSMIGKLLDVEPGARVAGTVASNVLAYQAGAHVFRVHDVAAHSDALRVAEATFYGPPKEIV